MDSNDQLRNLYLSKWEDLCKAMKPIIEDDSYEVKPTNPLLLWTKGDTEYETADIRVMIFGQETNDWMGVFNPNTNQNEEIEILKPHVILFLTGPDYDKRIEDKIGVLPFTPFSSYNERELAKVAVPNVHFAYRTYHPNYI